jgi:hypothetical protein
MEWSVTNLLIQIVTGILGAHAAAVAVKEYSFGVLGHTVAGMIGEALSGYFLQTLVATVVTGANSFNEPRMVEQVVVQGLAGAVGGGIAMLAQLESKLLVQMCQVF